MGVLSLVFEIFTSLINKFEHCIFLSSRVFPWFIYLFFFFFYFYSFFIFFWSNKRSVCFLICEVNKVRISVFSLLKVVSASGRLYTCIISCHYCPCPAFAHTVLRKNEGLLVSVTSGTSQH